jgi:hypothetical protein
VANKLTLSASVTVHPARKAKVGSVSVVTVRLGETIVAGGTFTGTYSERQVLDYLRRRPQAFVQHSGWQTYQDALKAKLI